MQEAKNTARALVRIGYDGTVHKTFRAAKARERFENELRVLQYLERRGCDFVPRVLGYDREKLELVTTNCGARVQQIGEEKLHELFSELEKYGVRHDDPHVRNVTYRASDGRFCIIDFEFATLLDETAAEGAPPPADAAAAALRLRWSAACEKGWLRPINEDRFLAIAFDREEFTYLARQGEVPVEDFDFVFAVSDGMGGERSGEFASRCAIDNITRLLHRRYALLNAHQRSGVYDCLEEVFQGTHRQLTVLSESYEEGHNMGATLSLLWYMGGWFYVGHLGDSRIYHLPAGGKLTQITEDHTHVGWLRRQGRLNEREARTHPRKNVLSQALGAGNQHVHPQLDALPARPGDRFLLCTDGVMEGLWDHALEDLLREATSEPGQPTPAERIVRTAIAESGRDNATAIVVEVC
jgi:serine/threonine protein phosphatase PrpC